MDQETVMGLRAKLAQNMEDFNNLMEKMVDTTTERSEKIIAKKMTECKKLSKPLEKPEKPEPPVEEDEGEDGEGLVDLGILNPKGMIKDLVPKTIYD